MIFKPVVGALARFSPLNALGLSLTSSCSRNLSAAMGCRLRSCCRILLDVWQPGEHNGTFRGHQLAFVTGAAALARYWSNNDFEHEVKQKEESYIHAFMANEIQPLHPALEIRGVGAARKRDD